jgi:hypothetical protein
MNIIVYQTKIPVIGRGKNVDRMPYTTSPSGGSTDVGNHILTETSFHFLDESGNKFAQE